MQEWLARKSNTLFNVLFVMMEGLELEFRELAWRKTCVLFLIDFFQLLRILTLPVFGWNARTSGLLEKFDIVYDFTVLGSMVVPRYAFFILAFVVVAFALAETIYVARIFEAGSVKQMWPVKILRFLVVMMVTTLFSSLVKWLLIPLSCLVSDKASFSEAIHGYGTDCDPFRFPEILATVPTLVVGIMYIAFAFCATTFSLQVNLLSRAPRSSSTGRVEILFLANKVAATCLVLLCNLVSPTAVAAILLLISLGVFWLHINTLPFHHHHTNMLRGGIYASVSWASLSSTIVSINDSLTLQWTLIALLPVMFLAGMWYVHNTHSHLLSALDRMRGEWEQRRYLTHDIRGSSEGNAFSPQTTKTPSLQYSRRRSYTKDSKTSSDGRASSNDIGVSEKPIQAPQNAMDRFYDTTGERRRIFVSGRHALACARVLLYQRRNEDREFLEHVIDRGLEDFRDYKPLIVFRILVMSAVMSKQRQAKVSPKYLNISVEDLFWLAEEKRIKDSGESIPIDLRYLLYCFEQKAAQEMAAQNLGKQSGGQISAITLMEFNLGLANAKEAHQKALQAIKHCWRGMARLAKSSRPPPPPPGTQDHAAPGIVGKHSSGGGGGYAEVVTLLENFSKLTRDAKNEYSSLLFKYPTSVELLFSYAAFLDVCMNDPVESEARLAQAIALQDGDGSDRDGGEGKNQFVMDDGKSATSGSSQTQDKRTKTRQFVLSWQHRIMGHQSLQLARLVFRIKIATLFLVMTAMVAFFISDFVLFKGMTKSEMHRVSSLGELYTLAVVIVQNTRTLMLSASPLSSSSYTVEKVREHGLHMIEQMQDAHVILKENADFPAVDELFNIKKFSTLVPTAGGWKEDRTSLWELGNEFTTRALLAYSTPVGELRNTSYKLARISDEKRNIPYLYENTFRVLVPNLEELKVVYVLEMNKIQQTVNLLVAINASCNVFLVLLIVILVMHGLWTVVHCMEGKALMCRLMASLPRQTSKSISSFYRKAEVALQEIEDEDAERKALVDGDGGTEVGEWLPSCSDPAQPVSPLRRPPPDRPPSPGSSKLWPHRRDLVESNYQDIYANSAPGSLGLSLMQMSRLPSSGGPGTGPGVELPVLSKDHDGPTRSSSSEKDKSKSMSVPFARIPSTPQRNSSRFLPANLSASLTARNKSALAAVDGLQPAAPVVMPLTTENLESMYRQTETQKEESKANDTSLPIVEAEHASEGVRKENNAEASGHDSGMEEQSGQEVEEVNDSDAPTQDGDLMVVEPGELELKDVEEMEEVKELEEDAGESTLGANGMRQDSPVGASAGAGVLDSDDAFKFVGQLTRAVRGSAPATGEESGGRRRGSFCSVGSDSGRQGSILRQARSSPEFDSARAVSRKPRPASVSFRTVLGASGGPGHGDSLGDLLEGLHMAPESKPAMDHVDLMPPPQPLDSMFPALGNGGQEASGFCPRQGFRFGSSPRPGRGPCDSESGGKVRNADLEGSVTTTGSESGGGKRGWRFVLAKANRMPDPTFAGEEEKEAMVKAELDRVLRKRRPWYLWTSTWLLMFAFVITLCVVSTVLATRDFGHLINLGPIVQMAGARLMLVKTAATFARELVLADGFSRLTQQELSHGLSFVIEEIRHKDRLVRLGNNPEEGIVKGADERNKKHNDVMYGSVCPWLDPAWLARHAEVTGISSGERRRSQDSAPTGEKDPWKCVDPAKPSVGAGGLLSVLVAYENALESILHRYGLPANPEKGAELFHYGEHPLDRLEAGAHHAVDYDVHLQPDRIEMLTSDDDVVYVLASTDGYLAQGLFYVMELFDHELDFILEEAVSLNEVLFSLYVVCVTVAFWYFLFNRSMSHAWREVENARALVLQMPLHILTQEEIERIADFFKDEDENDDEDHEANHDDDPGAERAPMGI